MLCLVDAVDIDAEQGIGQVAVCQASRVRKEEVDQEPAEGEQHAEAQLAEASVDLERSDDPIVVGIPEGHMLLERGEAVVAGRHHDRLSRSIWMAQQLSHGPVEFHDEQQAEWKGPYMAARTWPKNGVEGFGGDGEEEQVGDEALEHLSWCQAEGMM